MSVDILGTSWDQCRSMVQYSFTSTETRMLVWTDSPGRPPRLSHSSWTMISSLARTSCYINKSPTGTPTSLKLSSLFFTSGWRFCAKTTWTKMPHLFFLLYKVFCANNHINEHSFTALRPSCGRPGQSGYFSIFLFFFFFPFLHGALNYVHR